MLVVNILIVATMLLSACATPTPEIIKEIVTQVVKETIIVAGTPQIIEKVVTKEVEKVIKETVIVEKAVTPEVQERGGTLQVCLTQMSSYSNMSGWKRYAGGQNFYQGRTVFSGLVRFNYEVTAFEPELAESWEFDGNKVIFHLRKDVKWHDGEPFTAEDVLFTYGRLIPHPDMLYTGYGAFKDYIVGYEEFFNKEADTVSGITAPDDYTVVFEMKEEMGTLALHKICGGTWIMPEHILGQLPEDQWGPDESGVLGFEKLDFAMNPVGTGPFIVESFVPDGAIVYSPNKDYFLGAPKLDRLIYRSYGGDSTALAVAAEAGECDWVIGEGGGRPKDLMRLADMPRLNLEFFMPPANVVVAYWWNLGREHIKDPKIRQAIQHAIDGERFNQVMADGTSFGARVYLDGKWGINPKGAEYIKYDPELAKKMLEEAGWDPNDKLIYATGVMPPAWEPMHLTMQENLAAVGVQVEFKVAGADIQNVFNNPPYEWDLLQAGDWVPWFGLIGYEQTHLNEQPWFNRAEYYQEEVEMIKATAGVEDVMDLKDVVWDLQERLGADPFALLAYGHINPSLRSTKTRGCEHVIPGYYYQTNNWSLEKCWMAP